MLTLFAWDATSSCGMAMLVIGGLIWGFYQLCKSVGKGAKDLMNNETVQDAAKAGFWMWMDGWFD